MITTNRNIFLGVHITPKLKHALMQEINRRKNEASSSETRFISQSRVSYDLLREALIAYGHEDLVNDKVQ